MKLIIQTTVTIAAKGPVIAPVTNDTAIQTRGAQVIKMCTMTIGAGSQAEVQEILWTKLVARTIVAVVVGRVSLPCNDRALSQSRPQSAEFSQSASPRPGRPLSGPPLVSSQSQDSDVTVGGARRKAASFSRQVSETSSGKVTRLQVNPAVQERQEQARPTHSGCFSRSSPSPTFARKYRGSPGRGRMI